MGISPFDVARNRGKWVMNLLDMHIYCGCEIKIDEDLDVEYNYGPEMECVKISHNGDQQKFKCPKCGRKIALEFSLGALLQNPE